MLSRYLSNQFPRAFSAALCVVLLAGCTPIQQMQPSSRFNDASAQNTGIAQTDLIAFLGDAAEQSAAFFEQTPWGNQAEVTLLSRYFSGTGRECVRLKVVPAAVEAKPAIACRENTTWVPVRPVTQLLNAQ